jgi:excinuclease UvrABC ATPase subunit
MSSWRQANVSLDIPKRRLTVFTGVSGSGKSSLVFGTIAAESQRLINETYTAFIQSFMSPVSRPDVDSLRNLSAAIVVDQERMGANSRSTVGTATDARTMLRIIFSRVGGPHVGTSSAFSVNSAEGMCSECEGIGRVSDIDLDEVVEVDKSLNDGAITVPNFGVGTWYWQTIAQSGFVDPDVKLKDYTPEQWEDFLHKPATKIKQGTFNVTYEGLLVKVRRLYLSKDRESLQPHIRAFVDRAVTFTECAAAAAAGSTRQRCRQRSTGATSPSVRPCRSATWSTSSGASATRPPRRSWRRSATPWTHWSRSASAT